MVSDPNNKPEAAAGPCLLTAAPSLLEQLRLFLAPVPVQMPAAVGAAALHVLPVVCWAPQCLHHSLCTCRATANEAAEAQTISAAAAATEE
jgi:hypothetical protein